MNNSMDKWDLRIRNLVISFLVMSLLTQFSFMISDIVSEVLGSKIASDFGRYLPKCFKTTYGILGSEI
jgi:hypothetical protein